MREKLVEWRRVSDLTQDQAAERLGLSRSFYTQLERGTRSPSLAVMMRFIDISGPKAVEFFLPVEVASST